MVKGDTDQCVKEAAVFFLFVYSTSIDACTCTASVVFLALAVTEYWQLQLVKRRSCFLLFWSITRTSRCGGPKLGG